MAISSNRTPSPDSTRTNPNSRTPESSSTIRRSFSGNPFAKASIVTNARSFNPTTPANSPAGLSLRNSVGKEGIASLRVSYEQKENENDQNLKASRVKSPVKGIKNFMAPTISASSKVAASPRKKVLAERNEGLRVSFSDEIYPFTPKNLPEIAEQIGSKPEMVLDSHVYSEIQKKSEAVRVSFSDGISPLTPKNLPEVAEQIGPRPEMVLNSQVSSEIQRKTEALPELMLADSNQNEANFVFHSFSGFSKITETPESNRSSISVSDGKPSFNFLNSQASSTFNNLSESLSETRSMDSNFIDPNISFKDNSFCSDLPLLDLDPSLPPYDPKTNYLSPRPQFLHYRPNPRIEAYLNKEREFDSEEVKRLEESFSSENYSDSENTEETQSEPISSETISEEETEINVPDNTHEVRETYTSNKRFFMRSKSISLLLVLAIACLSVSVTDSPVLFPSIFKEQVFYKLHDAPVRTVEIAKAKFEGLAHEIKLWSIHSVSQLSKLIPITTGVEKLGSLQFVNLTVLDDFVVDDGYPNVHFGDEVSEVEELDEEIQEDDLEPMEKGGVEEELEEEIQTDEIMVEEEVMESGGDIEFEEIQHAQVFENGVEAQSNIELEKQSALIPQVEEIKPEVLKGSEFPDEISLNSLSNIESSSEEVDPHNSESESTCESYQSLNRLESVIGGTENKFLIRNVLGIALAALTLIATTVFIYLKQRARTSDQEAAIQVEQLPRKKLITGSVSVSRDNLSSERPSFRNLPTEVELVGESCPLEEMSSQEQSSSYHRRRSEKVNDEGQSHERKLRKNINRESMASSSEYSADSPSYGSFTTYEKKIYNTKHGYGEEEVVTPVRRSSRIRKQVTSP